MVKAKVSIDFEEELVGDRAKSESFYWKVTPKITVTVVDIDNEKTRKTVVKALKKALGKKVTTI